MLLFLTIGLDKCSNYEGGKLHPKLQLSLIDWTSVTFNPLAIEIFETLS